MKTKIFTLFILALAFSLRVVAQTYPLVTIHDVQFVSATALGTCNDVGPQVGDTIRLRGVAIMAGNQSTAYTDSKTGKSTAREVYLQDGWGPWSGIDVFTSGAGIVTAPTDIQNLVPGDSVEVTGLIAEYNGQTELEPFTKTAGGATFSNSCKFLGHRTLGAVYNTVKMSDLVDTKSINQLATGEEWESCFIELQNVTVTTVPTGSRTQFTVADASGNYLTVFDKFEVQRNGTNGNTFKVPHVGDIFKSIKGVLAQYSPSGPFLGTSGTYELYPFDSTDYSYSLSAPIINSVTRSPLLPKSTSSVTVTANVTPFAARGIKNVTLFYKTGTDTSVISGYTALVMTQSGSNYTATIPSQQEGTMVKYYVTAVDTISASPLRSYSPGIQTPGNFPLFYTVRNNGLTIYDVQFRPLASAYSGYNNSRVVVSGVVTASTKDLGYFYIQQPGLNAWAAINLKGSVSLASYNTGQYITVGGTVTETGNFTSITVDSIGVATGSFTMKPITLLDTLLTGGDVQYRKYMSMLTTLKSASGGKMNVIQKNADPTYPNGGFGDFRVGENTSNTLAGTRVTCGNYSASDPSSVNVSYINDSTLSKNLKVKSWRVIHVGDNMDSITGIMFYNFSNYKLLPRTNADIYNINNPVAGIENINMPNGAISIYPNPSEGNIHINFNNQENLGKITVNVLDMMGRNVYSQNISSSISQQDLNLNVKAGAYILTMTNSQGIVGQTKLLISK